jgi:hypothetical protein
MTISLTSLFLLFSCQRTKFQWQPGISAPKYYPVGGVVDFGNAGHGTTHFEMVGEILMGALFLAIDTKKLLKKFYKLL